MPASLQSMAQPRIAPPLYIIYEYRLEQDWQ